MCRILIVDDEQVFRDGLSNNVPWGDNNLEVVGEAQNGVEALRIMDDVHPDIVITDILMPQMSGLELAEAIRERYPHVKVIVLTVMDSFHYLRQSIRAQVTDYVLKFNYREELLPAVLKASRMIESERVILKETSVLHIKEVNFFRDCILGNISKASANELIRQEFPTLADMESCVILASADNESIDETSLYLKIQFEIKNLHIDGMKSYIVDSGKRTALVLFHHHEEDGELMVQGRTIIRRVTRNNPDLANLRIGIGSNYKDCSELITSCSEAELCLTMTEQYGTNILFFFNLKGDNSYYQILMQKVMNYIDSNYQNPNLSLVELSNEFNLSTSYFSTTFKQVFGMGFNEYLTSIRLNHVKTLLETSPLLNYEISEKVGYSSPQYMSIMFKRRFGMTPGEYRKTQGHSTD